MATSSIETANGLVTFHTAQGLAIRANLIRLTRHLAVFEICGADAALRTSEVLEEFKIQAHGQTVYSGRAVVSSVVNATTLIVCEAKLEESGLNLVHIHALRNGGKSLREHFGQFTERWQSYYRVRPDFKAVVGDMQCFLSELRVWLDQIELDVKSSPAPMQQEVERRVLDELATSVIGAIDSFIGRFEELAVHVEPDIEPIYRAYLRRQLHPLILSSPFAYRTFHKPLGYAGDYEMVDMMIREPYEGSTLFAKAINIWLYGQAPAQAHRNRVEYLEQKLFEQAVKAHGRKRPARVYNLGCGPAAEIQRMLRNHSLCEELDFTLLDFNQETLDHGSKTLQAVREQCGRSTPMRFLKKSVQQILKEGRRAAPRSPNEMFDLVYCAGLFDYLSDSVCKLLMNILYDMVAPGGLLVATNVSDAMNRTRPFRFSMEYLLDWHLIYRDGVQLGALTPDGAEPYTTVVAEDIGVNVMIEVKKPVDG
jgi:extracellular factor (EF) 3-hydroxypalmitic acid methyl ester biosynthesis protein